MSGLFGDYDVADAPDDPFSLDDGTYRGTVAAFMRVEGNRKSDDAPFAGLQVTLKPDDEVAYDHYFPLPNEDDPDRTKTIKLSKIKGFLTGMEVPASKMNTVTEDDLVGTRVIFKITTSKPNASGRTFRNLDVRLEGKRSSNSGSSIPPQQEAKSDTVSDDDFDL